MLIYNSYKLYESRCMVYPNRIKPFWMLIKYLDRVLVSWNQSQHRLQVEPQRTNVMIFKSTIKLLSQTKSTFIIIFRYWPYRNIFRSILYWIWFKSYSIRYESGNSFRWKCFLKFDLIRDNQDYKPFLW